MVPSNYPRDIPTRTKHSNFFRLRLGWRSTIAQTNQISPKKTVSRGQQSPLIIQRVKTLCTDRSTSVHRRHHHIRSTSSWARSFHRDSCVFPNAVVFLFPPNNSPGQAFGALLLGVLDTPVFLRRYLAAHNNVTREPQSSRNYALFSTRLTRDA